MGILEGLEPPVKRWSCKTRSILENLDKADRAILELALADSEKWTNGGLARALAERGIDIKADTLAIHRRGQCSCLKT
jgi:hypothetical protein